MYLFLAFVLVPIIEIALFIQVGGAIGLFPTLLIVVVTAVLGTWLVRNQGQLAMGQLRNSFKRLSDPTEPLAHGAMILFAGALLLTPGFFTDAVGFALLIPRVRIAVFNYLRTKITVAQFHMGQGPQGFHKPHGFHPQGGADGDTIDGDFHEVDPERKPSEPSKWVRGPSNE